MEVYFNNDGSYGQGAVYAPVLVNDKPIGFVSEVTLERVTCYLWDKFINIMYTTEQDIRSISFEVI